MDKKFYDLMELPYSYAALEPVLSEEQVKIHYDKHHKVYVDRANELLLKVDDNNNLDYGVVYKKLAFNISGALLHNMYWQNMSPSIENNTPNGEISGKICENFGHFEKFQAIFEEVATSIEGNGWAALIYCSKTDRLLLEQIQNHSLNIIPGFKTLLVLDMWEHAYYIDYKNEKKKYVQNFWSLVNWSEVNDRL